MHPCELCEKTFTLKHILESHMKLHTGEKPFTCELCLETFVTKLRLGRHLKIHISRKSHVCTTCGKTFSHPGNLKNHIVIHKGGKPFQCTMCEAAFCRKRNLGNHMKVHSGEETQVIGNTSDTTVPPTESPAKQLKTSSGAELYTCSLCWKTFIRKGDFKRHVDIHTGYRPHKCITCDKTFTLKGNLKTHMRIHRHGEIIVNSSEGELPKIKKIALNFSDRDLSRAQKMKKYKYNLSGEKPFACTQCYKTFNSPVGMEKQWAY